MLTDFIKPEHLKGWQHAARETPVEEYAQAVLDQHGADFERQRVEADRQRNRAFFEHMLRLPAGTRRAEAVRMRDLCAGAGQNVSDLDAIIATMA